MFFINRSVIEASCQGSQKNIHFYHTFCRKNYFSHGLAVLINRSTQDGSELLYAGQNRLTSLRRGAASL